jgi:hypothetical protein
MYDPYQRRRGELQSLGEIISAAIKVADPNYYRPKRPFSHGRKKKRTKDDGKLRGVQLDLFAPRPQPIMAMPDDDRQEEFEAADCTRITPNNPITDADVPF